MATSSIIENIRVNNPRALELYVLAMEEAAKAPLQLREKKEDPYQITDPDEIREIVSKNLAQKGLSL